MNRILNVDKMAGQELNSVSATLDRLFMDSCSQVNGTPPLFEAEYGDIALVVSRTRLGVEVVIYSWRDACPGRLISS